DARLMCCPSLGSPNAGHCVLSKFLDVGWSKGRRRHLGRSVWLGQLQPGYADKQSVDGEPIVVAPERQWMSESDDWCAWSRGGDGSNIESEPVMKSTMIRVIN